jgi:pentatricopeptide repeat protein
MLSKNLADLVIEYSLRFRSEGLLSGVRACNLLMSAYIQKRDFDSAYDVMNYMNFEEDFVRNRGVRVFTDKPDENIFLSHQNEIILRERLEIERQIIMDPRGSTQIDQSYYDKFGNCYDDIYHYRRMKYDVITVGQLNQSEILMNRAEIHQEILHKNYLADEETKRLTMTEQYKAFMRHNSEERMPEFGSNIHTFTSLILSPFLNIDSRNYYDRDKHVSLLLYTLFYLVLFYHCFSFQLQIIFYTRSLRSVSRPSLCFF